MGEDPDGLADMAAVSGLPDEATLTRLASELFAAPPGEAAGNFCRTGRGACVPAAAARARQAGRSAGTW